MALASAWAVSGLENLEGRAATQLFNLEWIDPGIYIPIQMHDCSIKLN